MVQTLMSHEVDLLKNSVPGRRKTGPGNNNNNA
jgi:hypothetical protein